MTALAGGFVGVDQFRGVSGYASLVIDITFRTQDINVPMKPSTNLLKLVRDEPGFVISYGTISSHTRSYFANECTPRYSRDTQFIH